MLHFQILQASAHPEILPGKTLTGQRHLAFPYSAVQVPLDVLAGKRPKKRKGVSLFLMEVTSNCTEQIEPDKRNPHKCSSRIKMTKPLSKHTILRTSSASGNWRDCQAWQKKMGLFGWIVAVFLFQKWGSSKLSFIAYLTSVIIIPEKNTLNII